MRICTRSSRRREEKREEADATWRCGVSRCLRACACGLCDVMLATHECTYYDIVRHRRHFAPRGRTSPYSLEMTGGTYISFIVGVRSELVWSYDRHLPELGLIT